MGDKTEIQWADSTWNPVTGCTKISTGCKFCYAERITERWGQDFSKIILHPDRLDQPLRWKKPRRIFVNSMSDMFHEEIQSGFIDRIFAVMAADNSHTYQILTKRADRMFRYLSEHDGVRHIALAQSMAWNGTWPKNLKVQIVWPLPNVHLGVSCEDQQRADERIPWLLKTPAAVRFLSLEPLLGPIDIRECLQIDRYLGKPDWIRSGWRPDIDWVIVGGESGGPPERALVEREWYAGPDDLTHSRWTPKAEALKWVREIRDQCVAAGVSFFHKQFGGPTPKSGGRLLDGRTWDEFPQHHDTERRLA